MATQTIPTPAVPTAATLRVTKTGFDLDKKDDVQVVKVGEFSPVTTMEEFVSQMHGDSAAILKIVNSGFKEFKAEQLAADTSIPWSTEDEETGALTPYAGSLLSEEKSKQLSANVLNMAKMIFGYAKDMVGGKAAKAKAKEDARDMLLANPQVIEGLKK